MPEELSSERPDLGVVLLAVNEAGYSSGLEAISGEGDLAVLQDDAAADVWATWAVEYRDVVIVDATNEAVHTFNLTTHDLREGENYAELKAILISVAEGNGVPEGDGG